MNNKLKTAIMEHFHELPLAVQSAFLDSPEGCKIARKGYCIVDNMITFYCVHDCGRVEDCHHAHSGVTKEKCKYRRVKV